MCSECATSGTGSRLAVRIAAGDLSSTPQIGELRDEMNERFDGVEKDVQEIKKDVKDIRQLTHDRAGTLATHLVKDRVERRDPPDQYNTPLAAK